jgi:hypothetical protein
MLGVIHNIWDKSKSVRVTDGDKFISVQGKQFVVKVEENNQLRLSLVKVNSDRSDQYREAVSNVFNLLESRRKDLAIIKQELEESTRELANEDLEPEAEEKLFQKVRDRRAVKKNHVNEIRKLEAQTTVKVNYRVVKTGLSAVLPPGLIAQLEFLPEPVCWCPHNVPACTLVEESTSENEELPLITADLLTVAGKGLERCFYSTEAKFVMTGKDSNGQLREFSIDSLVVESKEAEIKPSYIKKNKGLYEVSYLTDIEEKKQFCLAITYLGSHVKGSPFSVEAHRALLLEFSSPGEYTKDWLDAAVHKMSNIHRARLWVYLHDENGLEVYSATGETSCEWAQNKITASGDQQWNEDKHTDAIRFDNGDRLMIVGKNCGCDVHDCNDYEYDVFRSYNIIINKGWNLKAGWQHPRRLVIALSAPNVPGWTAPENHISFSSTGFFPKAEGNWPKFTGTFRICYKAV